ncbi:MAG: DNA-binding protein [Oscillospiraceae bacterium]|nr:DNA-binding protein [Oscillospiraceae bacterium]
MFEKDFRISYLLDFYGGILTAKQKDAIDLYYNEDFSLAEIAEHQHITRQGVRDAIKRGEEILLETEKKLGFAAKTDELTMLLEEVYRLSAAARTTKNQMHYYKIIEENIKLIAEKTKDFAPVPEKPD